MTHLSASDFDSILRPSLDPAPAAAWAGRLWCLLSGCAKAAVGGIRRWAHRNINQSLAADEYRRQLQHDILRIEARRWL